MRSKNFILIFHYRDFSFKVTCLIFVILPPFCHVFSERAPPVAHMSPFISIWNAPTEVCPRKHKISIDLRLFQFTGSPMKTSTNQSITLFYYDRLGHYPYLNEDTGDAFHGGIPQLIPLYRHFKKAEEDISFYIPSEKERGFAVIDWENWRPLWIRNWAAKDIYRKQSVEFVQQKDLTLTERQAHAVAKIEFEAAAQRVMLDTLWLGKSLRPNHFWGYFLFPDCYNYDYKQHSHNYTGSCPEIELKRNDELMWLWKESTALYPNMYLETALKSSKNAALFVRNRIKEAMRTAKLANISSPLPIYAYLRPVFTDMPHKYLSEVDLVHTLGESAAMGVSGFIMWGDLSLAQTMKTCTTLNNYLKGVLNPYIINVTLAAKMCSQVLCQNNGACTRKNWNASDYLHLNPQNFLIQQAKDGTYSVTGQPAVEDLQQFTERFDCLCYTGHSCKPTVDIQQVRHIQVCISVDLCITATFHPTLSTGTKETTLKTFSPHKETALDISTTKTVKNRDSYIIDIMSKRKMNSTQPVKNNVGTTNPGSGLPISHSQILYSLAFQYLIFYRLISDLNTPLRAMI
ncbi:hyaluronidase PH-20 [Microcaecilia unicolor]|uniref:Hyaluronidase n=1 Tax=Microcaecilia unicolor TaxID=1415580 RepID=A0A6P7Z7K7_9AMPH|nr:hyaluronidase PH-20 [Microcaecilia unicolor]